MTGFSFGLFAVWTLVTVTSAHNLYAALDFLKEGRPPRFSTDNWCARSQMLSAEGWSAFNALFMSLDRDEHVILYARRANSLYTGALPVNVSAASWLDTEATCVGADEDWRRFKFLFFDADGHGATPELYGALTDTGELYRGPAPDDQQGAWLAGATRLGVGGWHQLKFLTTDFHSGELYAVTAGGDLYKGVPPDGGLALDTWLNQRAARVGQGGWSHLRFLFFDHAGTMYVVTSGGHFYSGEPPATPRSAIDWLHQQALQIGTSGWADFNYLFYM